MEMRNKPFRVRYKFDDLVGEQVGFYGRDADAVDALHFIQRADEVYEALLAFALL